MEMRKAKKRADEMGRKREIRNSVWMMLIFQSFSVVVSTPILQASNGLYWHMCDCWKPICAAQLHSLRLILTILLLMESVLSVSSCILPISIRFRQTTFTFTFQQTHSLLHEIVNFLVRNVPAIVANYWCLSRNCYSCDCFEGDTDFPSTGDDLLLREHEIRIRLYQHLRVLRQCPSSR
ncbi:unnamed protein product [Cylicocyclus nassatus]|uniref:Uncharacterized protein n=1 Tax=Cylicocyclus nassatus TaxID=53992 RepID=A0AA36DNU5_CYLNA|nr:unnamed protein product [Cylicocyclus nassatus]